MRRVSMRIRRLTAGLIVVGVAAASLISTANAQTAPVAVGDTASVSEDQSVIINVLANDTPGGVTVSSVSAASHGTAIIASGVIVYTPKENFHGTDSFTYTITDGSATAMAIVTVTVLSVNDAPVARSDKAITSGAAVEIDVLKNEKDVDGDALSVVVATQPANGTAVLNTTTQKVTYTPTAEFTGTNTFTYYATDGQLNSETVTVTVKVKAETDGETGGREAKVLAACEAYSGPVNGVHTLCGLYVGNDLPVWARANLGKIILRHAAPASSEGVAEICARSDNGAQVERLCGAYESGWLPFGLQKKVGQMILTAATSSQATVGVSEVVNIQAEAKKDKPGLKPMGAWKSHKGEGWKSLSWHKR
ncbi:MAG: tandem-95 repeat protein [Chloroflexi bacterium]|nr:tandem-95 repeat protein [Chloroflexota bacterium]